MHFVNLRKYHNKIKKDLYDKYAKNAFSLLEIASGKGGDISKACNCNIKYVVGYDIDSVSVTEAKRRAKKRMNCKTKFKYYTSDLSSNVIVSKYKFDVISAMFSFHYFFKNSDTFNTIITSITKNLKKGGYFIGTMFDFDAVMAFIESNKKTKHFYVKKLNNTIKNLTIAKRNLTINNLFGNEIDVYIGNTVLNKPEIEYLVPFNKFIDIMKKYNFKLIESEIFNPSGILKGEEKQLSSLYRTFVFQLI
jgi:SAM-dependent methyltransferase